MAKDAQDGNRIKWEAEIGSFTLLGDGKEERIFAISHDFMEAFREEMIRTSGKSTIKIAMRKLLEKFGMPSGEDVEATWSSFDEYNNRQILPVSPEAGDLPEQYGEWDGNTRSLVLLPDIKMALWTVRAIQAFKEVMADIMTEKGATALMNGACRKAGRVIGTRFVQYFGWADLQSAVDNIDEVSRQMASVAGWGQGSASVRTGQDGKNMILVKILNCYEAHKIASSRPVCAITGSMLNGIWDSFADTLGGKAAEAREVRCAAKGDDYCAFAVKIKDKNAPHLDWSELEAEWQAIDAA